MTTQDPILACPKQPDSGMEQTALDRQASHDPLWQRIQPILLKEKLPQALLFVGPRHAGKLLFVNRLIAIFLCQHVESAPCGQCRSCHLLCKGIHPDISYIRQESPGGAIKIEQIRELQQNIYQTAQCGSRRFIIIDPADKMNIGAANALLKILEEPPTHTVFILIAEQMNSMPATVLSRCQKYTVPEPVLAGNDQSFNYLMLGQFYPQASARAELTQQSAAIIVALCHLIEGKCSPCTLAAAWSTYAFDDLLWMLYLITAEAINYQLVKSKGVSLDQNELKYFSQLIKAVDLFNCLEQINAVMRKINHNININQTLVLEDLLLTYVRGC